MGFFSGMTGGMTAGLYRYTVDGRRIYQLPSLAMRDRWPAYLVTDADVGPFEERLRRAFTVSFVVVIPLLGVASAILVAFPQWAGPWRWLYWIMLVAVVPGVATYATLRWWALRGIQRVVLAPSELQTFDRRAKEMVQVKAMGARTLIGLIFAAVVMIALQLDVLIEDGVWWAALGAALFGGSTLYMARQLWMLRRDERRR